MRIRLLILLTILSGAMPLEAQHNHTESEILVGPKAGRVADVAALLATNGLPILEKDVVSHVMRVGVPQGLEQHWIAVLGARLEVEYAERNGLGSGGAVPTDPQFGLQWHLENTGQSGGTAGADIEATFAWDITTGSTNVTIAVLDSGIDSDHPEFTGRIASNGWDFVNGDSDPEDDHGHGTQCAGVIGANANNGIQVAGIDWNCQILPIKVLNASNGGTTMDLAQALNYCATQGGIDIISMSLINYPNNTTLNNALQAASNAGIVLIACAGNGGIGNADVSYPGASPLTISVGASTRTDARASFSGTGAALDFIAPGSAVITCAYNSHATNATNSVSGCSFGTPVTAAVAGLLMARAEALGQPPLTQTDVFNLLQSGAEDQVGPPGEDTPGRDDFFGEGRVNARLSLEAMGFLHCAAGNVGVTQGVGPEPVLKVNGQWQVGIDPLVIVGTNEPITVSVDAPSTNPQPSTTPPNFALWCTTVPPSPQTTFTLPAGIGDMCFQPTFFTPTSFLFVSSFSGFGPVPPLVGAPWSYMAGSFSFPFRVWVQGVIIDTPQNNVAVTNLVAIDVRQLPPPVINGVTPPAATAGTTITVTGSDFRTGLTLDIGGQPITPATQSATGITFVMPAGIPCDSSLHVTNTDGQSDSIAFNGSPVILNVLTPLGTPAAGGTIVVVTGENFVPGNTVTIGGALMTLILQSTTAVTGTLPAGTAGATTLTLTTPDGCTASTPFTYTP